jgi:hypothetical protein
MQYTMRNVAQHPDRLNRLSQRSFFPKDRFSPKKIAKLMHRLTKQFYEQQSRNANER